MIQNKNVFHKRQRSVIYIIYNIYVIYNIYIIYDIYIIYNSLGACLTLSFALFGLSSRVTHEEGLLTRGVLGLRVTPLPLSSDLCAQSTTTGSCRSVCVFVLKNIQMCTGDNTLYVHCTLYSMYENTFTNCTDAS